MGRGNGGTIGVYRPYPASGIWSAREAQLKAAIKIDYAVIGGGASGGRGGSFVSGNTFLPRAQIAVTVGAVNGSSTFNGVTAAAGIAGDPTLRSYQWMEGWGYAYDGMAGGGPAFNAPTNGSPGRPASYGGKGGDGNLWSIDGQYYGAGKGGAAWASGYIPDSPPPYGVPGANGLGWGNYGSGTTGGGVILSYLSNVPYFFGGTITVVSGRVYHSFGSSGFLVPI